MNEKNIGDLKQHTPTQTSGYLNNDVYLRVERFIFTTTNMKYVKINPLLASADGTDVFLEGSRPPRLQIVDPFRTFSSHFLQTARNKIVTYVIIFLLIWT